VRCASKWLHTRKLGGSASQLQGNELTRALNTQSSMRAIWIHLEFNLSYQSIILHP
jgi:hypothetical protein